MIQTGRLITRQFGQRKSRAKGQMQSRPAQRAEPRSIRLAPQKAIKTPLKNLNSIPKRAFCSQTVQHETAEASIVEIPSSVLNAARGVDRERREMRVGDRIHGYEVLRVKWVEERQMMVYELEHSKTGAKHLHVACDDTENVFSTVLKTIPMNNTGVAHILEHLALCGSQKYPVRDPFFNMLKRSLSTYMNAWTGPDYTGYPFSTTNVKDYYNLMSVYLDAVFFPNLAYLDFLQEGHRLEINQETGKLEHMGVVYNEMKGAMSDASDIFSHEMHRILYPTTTYHYNSGGDPSAIRDITHENVIDFHREFYHPSNSYTMTYGDLPLAPHLEFIETHVLSKFERINPNSKVPNETRFSSPKRVEVKGPLSTLADPTKQTKIAVAWLTNKITENYESFCMSILSHLLTGGPTSPFYKALIASNIGLTYSPGTGYDGSVNETSFSVGLSDILAEDVEKVEALILSTLEEVERDGFPKERIDAIIHQIEYSQKHISSGFGLNLVSSLSHAWLHGSNPSDIVSINEFLAQLEADLKSDPKFLQRLIRKHLIDNTHRLTFIMSPDAEYAAREQQSEDDSLTKLAETEFASEEARERLASEAEALETRQEEEPNVSILPKIRLSEVSRQLERVAVKNAKVSAKTSNSTLEAPIQWADQPTAGISYMRANIDISDCPTHLLPYVPLFTTALANVGAADLDYVALSQAQELTSGAFRVSQGSVGDPSVPGQYGLHIGLYSAALNRNLEKSFELWDKILTNPRFNDTARLKTLVGNTLHAMQSSMVDSGHSYASALGSARLTGRGKVEELWRGVSQFNFIKSLHETEDLAQVSQHLHELAQWILDGSKVKFAINAESAHFSAVESRVSQLLSRFNAPQRAKVIALPHERLDAQTLAPHEDPRNVYFGLQTQVHYVTRSYRAAPYNSADYTKLDLLGSVMGPNFLHKEIREKGGAYGSGLSNGSNTLTFYSYRDPNVMETLDAFDRGIQWILDGEFTDEHLEEAKLQLFSNLDSPVPPSKKGLRFFESAITEDMAQARRDRVFATSRDDIIEACQKYLVGSDKQHPVQSAIAVFGSDQTETFKQSPDWIYREK
jgi:hypothetical protein